MVIVQTPLRISLFGGGTDFPSFYRLEGGCVLSSAIDKYLFLIVKERLDNKIVVNHTRTEITEAVDDVQHELIRGALYKTGIIHSGVDITILSDVPSGTGLGSSGSVTVGALHAMHIYRNKVVTAEQLAQEACEIEIDIIKKPIGKQDQYIAAYGGLRFFEFWQDGSVSSERIILDKSLQERLDECLLLFYTGVTRQAEAILGEQEYNTAQNMATLCQMKKLAFQAKKYLFAGEVDAIGHLLDESWQLKKKLASRISNDVIDQLYQDAIRAGALGGKIAGAGGGGYLMLYCLPEKKQAVIRALHSLKQLPFRLEQDGTKVISTLPNKQ